jgi:Bacterial aa3 type cytochrome c oxidase subunit IV
MRVRIRRSSGKPAAPDPGIPRLLHTGDYAKSALPGRQVGEDAMADHGELEYATAEGNDYPAHENMYRSFVTLVKTGIIVVAIIVILMAYFLV